MALAYPVVLIIGLAISVLLFGFSFIRFKKSFKGGKKYLTPDYLKNDPYLKRKKFEYHLFYTLSSLCLSLSILSASFVLSRPYENVVTVEDRYSRDIILCLDVSTSVDDLNKKLVKNLENTVKQLQGERVGIVIFNTTPLLLVPLTDDYTFINEQLEEINKALEVRDDYLYGTTDLFGTDDETYYYINFLAGGTQVGADERGSSMIGDGLASCVNDFTDEKEARTRIIILSTDNALEGEPIFTLSQAADLCVSRECTVYGIGTEEMDGYDKANMKSAVEKTGGKFYMEEDEATFSNIVENINQTTENLVSNNKVIHKEDRSTAAVCCLIISLLAFLGFARLARR